MRLRSIWIGDYKNPKNFSIAFEDDGFIDIFVGQNGSGKSNFLEALIEIFDHIYSARPGDAGPEFGCEMTYAIGERDIRIGWRDGDFSVNGRAGRQTLGHGLSRSPGCFPGGQSRPLHQDRPEKLGNWSGPARSGQSECSLI